MVIIFLIILGLCFGSFANAFVWRMHEQSKPKSKRAASDRDLSMLHGRSMCTHCKHVLGAWDLLPLFSWLMLRGRCRYCHVRIDDTPLAEALLPLVFVVSYLAWPGLDSLKGQLFFGVWLVSLVAFTILVIYDVRWMLLPDRIVLPLIGLTAVNAIYQASQANAPLQALEGLAGALLVSSGLFYALYKLSDGKWIGGGDYTLGLVLGLLLMTPAKAMLMVFAASLLGTLYALPYMVRGRMTRMTHLPYGPFLIVATVGVELYGQQVIDAYLRYVGLAL